MIVDSVSEPPGVHPGAPAGDVAPTAAAFLRLLADPTRRQIFLRLMAGETCNCELVDDLGLAQNLVSHHVRQLRLAGLVIERRDSNDRRWVYYRVDPAALTTAWAALTAALHPARLETREPRCGPLVRDASGAAPAPPAEDRCGG